MDMTKYNDDKVHLRNEGERIDVERDLKHQMIIYWAQPTVQPHNISLISRQICSEYSLEAPPCEIQIRKYLCFSVEKKRTIWSSDRS